jgi:uncharacterized protein YqjF (DUF2071 family)
LLGRTTATQQWRDLAFLHWRVDASAVRPLLPPGTRPDEFDGSSWVGLIGFDLLDATLWGSPPVPFAGSFTEINVRLYAVDGAGRRGVVFRSLEASRLLAVIGARAAFSIPYYWSRTSHEVDGDTHRFAGARHTGERPTSTFAITRSADAVADPLADFLTARWALFTSRRGRALHLPNTHERWDLYAASLDSLNDELVAAAGLPGVTYRPPDSVLYSPGVTARFGRPN